MTASNKGRKARNPWVQIAPGIRSRNCTESPAATARWIERNMKRDILGMGHWQEPADWRSAFLAHRYHDRP
jgi:hypothetical protein